MPHKPHRQPMTRRRFVAGVTGSTALAAGLAGFPYAPRAAAKPVKLGLLHPVTGFLQATGGQCRFGAIAALDEINRAGGIRALGGARIEALLGDARSTSAAGVTEVAKLDQAGVAAIVGAGSELITAATTRAAAKFGIPHAVDVGVSDRIVTRGLTNVFRFGPGYGTITKLGLEHLVALNAAAGKPVETVMLVYENSTPFGPGMARLLGTGLKAAGFDLIGGIGHPSPHRNFDDIVDKIEAAGPDLVIPSSYAKEYALLLRTMRERQVRPTIYSVLGGNGSSYKFLKEFPAAAQHALDCNHWFDTTSAAARTLRRKTVAAGRFFTAEVFLAYNAVKLVADAIERAGSADRAALVAALGTSTWSDHIMPYGPTRFVDGQNQGARPLVTQYQDDDIAVVAPRQFRTRPAVFSRPV